jgi:hypothetical protein
LAFDQDLAFGEQRFEFGAGDVLKSQIFFLFFKRR